MVTTNLVTFAGPRVQNRQEITERHTMWNSRVYVWFSKTLSKTIPMYLLQKLCYFYDKVTLPSKLRRTYLGTEVDERRVYDLVNCGPQQRFVVSPGSPVIVHNCSYGAGPQKIRLTLSQGGIEIPLSEAKELHAGYWRVYSGVKKYEQYILAQWRNNRGWLLNGIGRPICVAQDYQKDIVNRVVQSTGHDCFMLFTKLMSEEFERRGIPWNPFNYDLHDATYIEVPDAYVKEAKNVIDNVIPQQAKEILGGVTTLKWDANVCSSVFDDKPESPSVTELGVQL